MLLFQDLLSYVRFDTEDRRALLTLASKIEPHFDDIIGVFYERVLEFPDAVAVLENDEQIDRLRQSMRGWLVGVFLGSYDDAYFESRAAIGRVHVRIGLKQHFMLTGMNVMRTEICAVVEAIYAQDTQARRKALQALHRILDVDLAIMLHTYREDSRERLRRQERLANLGQFAGTVAHELRNPLGVIESSAYLIAQKIGGNDELKPYIERINRHTRASADVIASLLTLVRDNPLEPNAIAVEDLVERALAAVEIPPTIELHCGDLHNIRLDGDDGLLSLALNNLVRNAVAMVSERPGRIDIAVISDGQWCEIKVADNGPGFTDETLKAAFEPLVSSRADGIGLGLALVRRVCERHGGEAQVYNRAEGGAVVIMRIPCNSAYGSATRK